MPYVSRKKQFSPQYIDGLFVWIDNYSLIQLDINSNLSDYTFRDTTEFNNNIIGTNNIRLSNAKVNFSDYDYAQSLEEFSIPSIPNSFTIFYVGQAGIPQTQNNLITLFNADSNSIKNSNTIAIIVDQNNIAYATNLQSTGDNLDKYNGAYSFIGNTNSINIFTATFDQNNSQLWVNGITNGVLSSSCSNIFPIGNVYNNILTIQSNNGFYTNNPIWLNSFNETLVYDHILTNSERIIIEKYLANKWETVYPGSPLTNISAISVIYGLINWYNNTTIIFQNGTDPVIDLINDLSGFSNTLEFNTEKLYYDSNYNIILPFNFSRAANTVTTNNSYYNNYIFTPHIINKGITVSFITTNSFYQASPQVNTSNIMTLFSPDYSQLELFNYPTVKTDGSYNIFAGGNVYSSVNAGNSLFLANNKFTNSNLNADGLPTPSNIKELCVITMQFIDYNSYGTTQLFMNGYPMMISSNGPSNWLGSNFNLYYAGIPAPNNIKFSHSPLDLGETLIYNKILTRSELSVVHGYLLSNYSISNKISSNGLIGWFDAADYSSSVGTVLNRWSSKGGIALTLSNPNSNSFALVRNYLNIAAQSNLTFIDLNNGAPSYFVNNTSVPISTYSNLIVFYAVLGNSNLTTNGYITSFGHSNGSVTYFAQSGFNDLLSDVLSEDRYIKQNNLKNVFGNTNPQLITIQTLASQIVSVFLSFPNNITPISYFSGPPTYIFSGNIDTVDPIYKTQINLINSLRTQIFNINPIYAPLSIELGINNWLAYVNLNSVGIGNGAYLNYATRILEINNIINSNIYATTNFSTKPNNQPIITGAYASNSDNSLMRFDTVSQNTMTIGSVNYNGSNISNINIGAYLGINYCKAQIGEVLIYNRPLDKYEYMNVLGYLQSKWCSPTVTSFPTDYLLRYDACNISLNLSNWQSSENKGPLLNLYKNPVLGSVSFAYFNRPFLSNSIFTHFSNALSISLEKGFTIFTVTSNANTFGNIVSFLNSCNNTLQPNIYLSNTGTSNIFSIGNRYDSIDNIGYNINETYSYTPLNSTSPLINCFKYSANTSSYSITTKGATLQINTNNRYTSYTNYIDSNYNFNIGGLGLLNPQLGFDSLIGEVLVYNRHLNDYETELVSANLTEKWNTPLSYPILFESRTISCNFSFSITALQNNTLTLCNIPLLSNYYNFPMSILFTSVPSLGNPVRTGINPFRAVYSSIYGSCNYLITMSTNNPFGSASLVLYSNTTPPGIPRFPTNYTNYSIRSNLQIENSNNTMLVFSNILLTSILCNDAYGYDRNYTLRLWYALTFGGGQNALTGTVTSNQYSNGLYNSNITYSFSNLVENTTYFFTLNISNISGSHTLSFPGVRIPYSYPFFSNNFVPNGVSQPIAYAFSNFTSFRFNNIQGAAKPAATNNYYVTMNTNNIPVTNFTTTFTVAEGIDGSIYNRVQNLTLSNLIGMTVYNNITLIASNATGIMPASSPLGIRGSNSLGSFTTPPGPPTFLDNIGITCNITSRELYYSNISGPILLCNSVLYPTGGGGTWNSINNNKSGIFYFFQLRSNATLLTPNYLGLSNNLFYPIGGNSVTVRTGFIRPTGSVESNMWLRLSNLPVTVPGSTYQLTTIIYASNLSGIASNVLSVQY